MDDVIVVDSDGSEYSILEIELPKKPSPPLILIEDEEIVLNVVQEKQKSILAEEFIKTNKLLPAMTENQKSVGISNSINSPSHWTSDMIKYYEDDWGDEDQFIVEKLQEKMDKSSFLWDISKKDKLHRKNKIKRSNVRCWNCYQFGHNFSICSDPPRAPKCYMCGTQGHLEYRCPNSKCLNCGNPSKEYEICCLKCKKQSNEVCSRCHLIGHNFFNCSDHWRLFHLTTNTTSVIVPNKNIYKLDKDMWCCNCGKQGHYQTHCWQRRDLASFRDTLPFVVSYQKAFNESHYTNNSKEFPEKKNNGRRKQEANSERILKVNPLNKAIRKNKQLKNKKRIKRNKHQKYNHEVN